MKKIFLSLGASALLFSSVFAGAPAAFAAGACPVFSGDLSVGSYGPDVSELQSFLLWQNPANPSWMITGYFGPATQTALFAFQATHGIPQTGYLDSYTRSVIANCGAVPYPGPAPYSYAPSYDYGCVYTSYASLCPPIPVSHSTAAPVPQITNVSGPATLSTGEPGIWNIAVSAPGYIKAALVPSWSDPVSQNYGASPSEAVYGNQTFTLSHTFYDPGIYSVTFTLTDEFGRTSTGRASVTVANNNYPLSPNPYSGYYYW